MHEVLEELYALGRIQMILSLDVDEMHFLDAHQTVVDGIAEVEVITLTLSRTELQSHIRLRCRTSKTVQERIHILRCAGEAILSACPVFLLRAEP